MPYKRDKLSDAEIATLAKWIDAGANYDEPLKLQVEPIWSLKPLKKIDPPATKDGRGRRRRSTLHPREAR
jgi:hypothetical protein